MRLDTGGQDYGTTSWRGQIDRALNAIDRIGTSKYAAKQEQAWQPGEAVAGLFSHGYRNTVFNRAGTFTHWLREEYPTIRLFRDVDHEMTAEFLSEKAETCTPGTVRTLLATLKKLQEGLYTLNWIHEDMVPMEWRVIGRNPPRGPYEQDEAAAIQQWVEAREPKYGQALRFILSSGARIDETLHLRADKIFANSKRVELVGKGGRVRRIQVLHADVVGALDISHRFVYLDEAHGPQWKDGLERVVRQGCDALNIHRRGVHGFRGTTAGEFIGIKRALGHTEMEARHELATLAPHKTACGAVQACGWATIRIVHFGTRTAKLLWEYMDPYLSTSKPHDYLFYVDDSDPRRLNRHALANMLRRLSNRAGVKNVHPHRFRHTFATEYLRNNGQMIALKDLLGHADFEMVEHYAHFVSNDIQRDHQNASPVDNWKV